MIRTHLHPSVLVTTGGGGVGRCSPPGCYERVRALANCDAIDVLALHSYAAPDVIDAQLHVCVCVCVYVCVLTTPSHLDKCIVCLRVYSVCKCI